MSAGPAEAQKADVRAFWEERPCGAKHAEATEGTRAYFDQIEQKRAQLEPFIEEFADFAGGRGKEMLEIGVGIGTDSVRFARAGARLTGIDLTEHAVRLVRRRLELENLQGDIRVADAERLPFADGQFDRVYSWGVLHHTPDTERAVREAIRVLKPGGELCVMLYARYSWVAFGLRVRYALLKGRLRASLSAVLSEHMESAGTKAFTPSEARKMFKGLADLSIERVGTPYDRRVAGPLARLTGRYLGWFMVTRGRPT